MKFSGLNEVRLEKPKGSKWAGENDEELNKNYYEHNEY